MIIGRLLLLGNVTLGPRRLVVLMKLSQFGWRFHRDADRAAQQGIERVDPEDLGLEDAAGVAGDGFGYGV